MKCLLHSLAAALLFPLLVSADPFVSPADSGVGPKGADKNHFLFLVDSSLEMAEHRVTLRNLVHDWIQNGLEGLMEPGDAFVLWPFHNKVDTQTFPAETWRPGGNRELALRAYQYFQRLPFDQNVSIPLAVHYFGSLVEHTPQITLVLVSNGRHFIKGTPFDDEINQAYRQKALPMHQAGRPLITMIYVENKKALGWAVFGAGEKLQLPKPPPSETKVVNKTATQKTVAAKPPKQQSEIRLSSQPVSETVLAEPSSAKPVPPGEEKKATNTPGNREVAEEPKQAPPSTAEALEARSSPPASSNSNPLPEAPSDSTQQTNKSETSSSSNSEENMNAVQVSEQQVLGPEVPSDFSGPREPLASPDAASPAATEAQEPVSTADTDTNEVALSTGKPPSSSQSPQETIARRAQSARSSPAEPDIQTAPLQTTSVPESPKKYGLLLAGVCLLLFGMAGLLLFLRHQRRSAPESSFITQSYNQTRH